MEWIVPIFSLITFSGLLFYFRWIDAKNADLRSLREYIKSVEHQIEQFMHKKQKEFDDKMIPAEIAIDRMEQLALTLQEKAENFDKYLQEGEDIYRELRQEMGSVSGQLKDYRRIRSEFDDIEKKISDIVAMRDIVTEGSQELDHLRSDMITLKTDYDTVVLQLTNNSKKEFEDFFNMMQRDLTEHLSKAQRELAETDGEIRTKIQDLLNSTEEMSKRMQNFKDSAENGITGLQEHFHNEMTVLKGMAESNAEEIIDRWNQLKEHTENERLSIETTVHNQNEFFNAEHTQIKQEMEKIHTFLDAELSERMLNLSEYEEKITDNLKILESGLKSNLEQGLEEKVFEVRKELENTQHAFSAQEQELAEKLDSIAKKASARVESCENDFYNTIENLQNRIHDVTDKADKILHTSELKIDDRMVEFKSIMQNKVDENMRKLEENFRSENDERLKVSIEEVTKTLEDKYIKEYQETFQNISLTASELEDQVREKFSSMHNLESSFKELQEVFAKEKDHVLMMVHGLEENHDKQIRDIEDYLSKTEEILQQDLKNSIDNYFEENIKVQKQEQEDWSHRYEESILNAQNTFNSIKDNIDNINREIKNIENNTLNALKEESSRFLDDAARRLEDLKHEAELMNRDNKDMFHTQLENARKTVGEIKEELWNQGSKVREQASKDFERLNERVRNYDSRLNEFIKKTEVLDRLEGAAEKFQGRMQELENLKKDLDHLFSELKTADKEGQETTANLKLQNDVLEKNGEQLAEYINQADLARDSLDNSLSEANKLGEFLSRLEEEKESAQKIEDLLLHNLERYQDLREALDELENRKSTVDEMLLNIDNVHRMMNNTAEISDKIAELGHFALELQKQIALIEEELSSAINTKNHLRNAIEKVTDLDNLLLHVEQERQSVEKMLQYVSKASGMIKPAGTFEENSPEQTKRIMNLYNKNWSVKEISERLGLSPVFVEMTIDKNK